MNPDPPSDLTFRHYTAAEARNARDLVEQIFLGSYTDAIASGEQFEAPEAFMHRFDTYTDPSRGEGFELVVGCLGDEPFGQAWGWPLTSDSHWWSGLQLDEGDLATFTAETGSRTFALSEIMVRAEFTGHSLAHALHDELLTGRAEARATLLVRPTNRRARSAYVRWGWSRVGALRPTWPGAPEFDALMRQL